MRCGWRWQWGIWAGVLFLAACTPVQAQSLPQPSSTAALLTPTASPFPSATPPVALATVPVVATSSPTVQVEPSPTLAPTSCPPALCVFSPAFPLVQPMQAPDQVQFDGTYRFGTTPGRWRSPHRGVDIQNPQGAAVHAATEGRVVFAGRDQQEMFGPSLDFYGNLIVLEHSLSGYPHPLYTLYGHLSRLLVSTGQSVMAGQEIGQVGMSGVAMGTHLHFEVRLGGLTYKDVLNPELWLQPLQLESGGLAVQILGQPPLGQEVVVEGLASENGPVTTRHYGSVYQVAELIGRPPYNESFALGSLAPGWYRVTFAQYGIHTQTVQVFPGQLTIVTFNPGE